MIINIIGDCDKRPVLYSTMKICQTLGDVLLITSSSRLIRLSDSREVYGHYQNTMIAVTYEGIDDLMSEFSYDMEDFDFVIIDNIVSAEADTTIYVKGMIESEFEKDVLEYVDDYEVIELYKGKLIDSNTMLRCEEFEALRDMCPMSNKVAEKVATILAKALDKPVKNLIGIATAPVPGARKTESKPKSGGGTFFKKKGR